MPISQNVTFVGEAQSDPEFDHPAGASIARRLEAGLRNAGWLVSDIDNWRDCGWSIECSRGDVRLEVSLALIDPGKWMLQVAPWKVPGPLGRLFGKRPSAMPADVLDLAKAVHAQLVQEARYSQFSWCWDGFPEEGNSASEPRA